MARSRLPYTFIDCEPWDRIKARSWEKAIPIPDAGWFATKHLTNTRDTRGVNEAYRRIAQRRMKTAVRRCFAEATFKTCSQRFPRVLLDGQQAARCLPRLKATFLARYCILTWHSACQKSGYSLAAPLPRYGERWFKDFPGSVNSAYEADNKCRAY